MAKGANQATFSQEWQLLTQEITTCHEIANGIAARPKDARFKSLCVFELTVGREQVGQKQKSFACRVNGHTVPTMENWKQFFVGYNPILKKQVWIRGRSGSHLPRLPFRTVHETFTSYGSRQLARCHRYC